MITIYGIKNCDTMKKAFAWLDGQKIAYTFHDYKKAGIDKSRLSAWCAKVGWEVLVNKRGTTWRKLTLAQQAVSTQAGAIALMLDNPSLRALSCWWVSTARPSPRRSNSSCAHRTRIGCVQSGAGARHRGLHRHQRLRIFGPPLPTTRSYTPESALRYLVMPAAFTAASEVEYLPPRPTAQICRSQGCLHSGQ